MKRSSTSRWSGDRCKNFRLGLFDQPYVEPSLALAKFDTPNQRRLARLAAAKGVCVLTNDGVLPVSPTDLRSVAMIGPHADDARLLQGDYHYPAHLEIIYKTAWSNLSISDSLKNQALPTEPAAMETEGLPTAGGAFRPGPHFTPHVTPLAGLQAALGPDVSVTYTRGCHDSDADDRDFDSAVEAARAADVAVVCVGASRGW